MNVALVPDPPRPDVPDLYKVLRSNAQGQFTILGVAPGHYQLFAIEGSDANAYLDSDWVESLQDYAQELSVEENSSATLTLKADSADPATDKDKIADSATARLSRLRRPRYH